MATVGVVLVFVAVVLQLANGADDTANSAPAASALPSTANTADPTTSAHKKHSSKTSAHTTMRFKLPTTANKPHPKPRPKPTVLVTRVVDGDTVHISRNGPDDTVRLLGIDTPETKDPRRGVGCYGPQASAWATATLEGRRVGVTTDPTQDRRDKYGRLLAYLRLPDGSDYSVKAARLGYAKYYLYDVPVTKAAAIQRAESSARAARRGLWGPPCNGSTDAAPKSAPTTQHAVRPYSSGAVQKGRSYANCAAARAAGVAPLHRGDAGYSTSLDRDSDGVACE